ncbi:MAG: ABC transporter substrate-binding protein [Candidatus Binataceae bacterium]
MRPEFYPDRPSSVEHKQTHMSDVFLAGECVYKIKKPVCLDFVDCWALGARYLLCREEVRLNRRLAPEVYLDVVPILESGADLMLGGAGQTFDHKVREYAVKMRRLPDKRMLDRLVREGQVDNSVIATIAGRLAAFHAEASPAKGWLYGSATAVARLVFAIGRYWSQLNDEQRRQYMDLFPVYMAGYYWKTFSIYYGSNYAVLSEKTDANGRTVVHTQIQLTNDRPAVRVDWYLMREGGAFKIVDVEIEGLSQNLSYRDYFADIIQHNGGDVSVVLDTMRQHPNG